MPKRSSLNRFDKPKEKRMNPTARMSEIGMFENGTKISSVLQTKCSFFGRLLYLDFVLKIDQTNLKSVQLEPIGRSPIKQKAACSMGPKIQELAIFS